VLEGRGEINVMRRGGVTASPPQREPKEVNGMNFARGAEEVMTDFQFKALMTMVLEILEKSDTVEEAKKVIKKLAEGKFGGYGTEE
jgi:hypothetical protein